MSDQGRSVVITGAAGLMGRYIVSEMAVNGWKVIGLDQYPLSNATASREQIHEWYKTTLPSPVLDELLSRLKPQALIHAAGPASVLDSVADPAADFQGSVQVFFQVLDSVRRKAPECRVVFFSSAAVYGNPLQLPVSEEASLQPISPYGFHKLICENLAKEFHNLYHVSVCSIRIFSAYGQGLRRQVLWDICQKALHEPVVELWGNGEETRDFVHAQDVAQAVNRVISHGSFEGQVYNVGTGQETSIRALTKILLSALKQAKEVRFTGKQRTGDPVRWCANISRLAELGYQPTVSIFEGAQRYARWVIEGCSEGNI